MAIRRMEWNAGSARRAIWASFERDGVVWFHCPGASVAAQANDRRWNLMCTYPPFILEGDDLGVRLDRWVERARPIEFRMEKDDVFIANNFRMIHSRRAFQDGRRLLHRMLVEYPRPMEVPADLRQIAQRIERGQRQLERRVRASAR